MQLQCPGPTIGAEPGMGLELLNPKVKKAKGDDNSIFNLGPLPPIPQGSLVVCVRQSPDQHAPRNCLCSCGLSCRVPSWCKTSIPFSAA
jgi:hypothetical protein